MKAVTEDRLRRIRNGEHVEIPQHAWYFAALFCGNILGVVACGWMLRTVAGHGQPWFSALTSFEGWIAIAGLALCATALVVIPVQALQRATLEVSADSVRELRTKNGSRSASFAFPWGDVESVAGRRYGGRWPAKGQYVTQLTVSPDAYDSYLRGLSPIARFMQWTAEKVSAPNTISLHRFSGGAKEMHELLAQVHSDAQ